MALFPAFERLHHPGMPHCLPLGTEYRTSEQGKRFDLEGRPLSDPASCLQDIQGLDLAALVPLVRRRPLIGGQGALGQSLDDLLKPFLGALKLATGCSLIGALVEKARDLGQLDHFEILALRNTMGHFPHGEAANALVRVLGLAGLGEARIASLADRPAFPLICAKLRAQFPRLALKATCNCRFSRLPAMVYPSPIFKVLTVREVPAIRDVLTRSAIKRASKATQAAGPGNSLPARPEEPCSRGPAPMAALNQNLPDKPVPQDSPREQSATDTATGPVHELVMAYLAALQNAVAAHAAQASAEKRLIEHLRRVPGASVELPGLALALIAPLARTGRRSSRSAPVPKRASHSVQSRRIMLDSQPSRECLRSGISPGPGIHEPGAHISRGKGMKQNHEDVRQTALTTFESTPGVPETIARIRFINLVVRLRARGSGRIGGWLGSVLHGALGRALYQVNCVTPRLESCAECSLGDACAFPTLFGKRESGSPSQTGPLRGMHDARPLIIRTDIEDMEDFHADDVVTFELVLIGNLSYLVPYLVAALRQLAALGLGRDRVQFDPLGVWATGRNGYEEPVWRPASPVAHPDQVPVLGPAALAPLGGDLGSGFSIAFKTPLRITGRDGKLVRTLPLGEFLRSLRRRLELAEWLSRPGPPTGRGTLTRVELPAGYEAAPPDCRFRRVRLSRFDERQARLYPLEGLRGEVVYRGVGLDVLEPFLRIGQWLHVGRSTSFGFGQFEVVPGRLRLPGPPN